MSNIHRQKVLALAAIFQAAALADQLARRGSANTQDTKALLDSLIIFDTDNPEAIYGTPQQLLTGLKSLEGCLSVNRLDDNNQYANQLHYALGMIQLEKQLSASNKMLDTLRQRLEQIQKQLVLFDNDIMVQAVINNFAGIYVDTIGTFKFRLQIKGKEQTLQTVGVPEQIRAVLLAGIRAAWLWRRLGGRRWHLLFTRSAIMDELRLLIKEMRHI